MAVSVPVGVIVGDGVAVADGLGVLLHVGVGVQVAVPLGVALGVSVSVAVKLAVSLGVGVAVPVGVALGVSVGVTVGLALAVAVSVSVSVGVAVEVALDVGVQVAVLERLGVTVQVSVAVGVYVSGVTFGAACCLSKQGRNWRCGAVGVGLAKGEEAFVPVASAKDRRRTNGINDMAFAVHLVSFRANGSGSLFVSPGAEEGRAWPAICLWSVANLVSPKRISGQTGQFYILSGMSSNRSAAVHSSMSKMNLVRLKGPEKGSSAGLRKSCRGIAANVMPAPLWNLSSRLCCHVQVSSRCSISTQTSSTPGMFTS